MLGPSFLAGNGAPTCAVKLKQNFKKTVLIHLQQSSHIFQHFGQEAQLPQRNSASAAQVYLGWLTDRARHRTPQNRRGCVWHSNALIQEVLAENAFLHEIATRGHWRSFILQSFDGRQGGGSISSYNIACRTVSLAVVDNPQCGLMPPPKGTPANIRMNLIFSETRFIGLHFCRW